MKKLLSLALFGLFLTALSVTAALADPPATQPGCAPEVMQAQQNHVDALQVRDKAIERQIVTQNDNSLGMTCYDHQLGLTARLGQIFSDTYPKNDFPAANTAVFGTLYDPASGGGKLLAEGLTTTAGPLAGAHARNFNDSLSLWLGATALNFMSSMVGSLTDSFTNFVDSITSMITSINAAIASVDSAMKTLFTIMDLLGSVMPSLIPTTVIAIKQAWKEIRTTRTDAVQEVQKLIRDTIKTLTDQLNSTLANILGDDADKSTSPCSRIQQLWNPGVVTNAVGGFRSVLGGGVEQGTPYQTFAELLNKGAEISGVLMAVGGTNFQKEINNATNSTILQNALSDITGSGILSGASSFLTTVNKVPAPEALPALIESATMQQIRGQM